MAIFGKKYANGQRTRIGNITRLTKYLHTLVTRSLPVSVSATVVFIPLTPWSQPPSFITVSQRTVPLEMNAFPEIPWPVNDMIVPISKVETQCPLSALNGHPLGLMSALEVK